MPIPALLTRCRTSFPPGVVASTCFSFDDEVGDTIQACEERDRIDPCGFSPGLSSGVIQPRPPKTWVCRML
jgi:hypothetical protein